MYDMCYNIVAECGLSHWDKQACFMTELHDWAL